MVQWNLKLIHFEQSLTHTTSEVCLSTWQLPSVQNIHNDSPLFKLRLWTWRVRGHHPLPALHKVPEVSFTIMVILTLYVQIWRNVNLPLQCSLSMILAEMELRVCLGTIISSECFLYFSLGGVSSDQWVPFKGLCREIRVKHFPWML